jgi:hypothetical protein
MERPHSCGQACRISARSMCYREVVRPERRAHALRNECAPYEDWILVCVLFGALLSLLQNLSHRVIGIIHVVLELLYKWCGCPAA